MHKNILSTILVYIKHFKNHKIFAKKINDIVKSLYTRDKKNFYENCFFYLIIIFFLIEKEKLWKFNLKKTLGMPRGAADTKIFSNIYFYFTDGI
jgi:hypothetical protein